MALTELPSGAEPSRCTAENTAGWHCHHQNCHLVHCREHSRLTLSPPELPSGALQRTQQADTVTTRTAIWCTAANTAGWHCHHQNCHPVHCRKHGNLTLAPAELPSGAEPVSECWKLACVTKCTSYTKLTTTSLILSISHVSPPPCPPPPPYPQSLQASLVTAYNKPAKLNGGGGVGMTTWFQFFQYMLQESKLENVPTHDNRAQVYKYKATVLLQPTGTASCKPWRSKWKQHFNSPLMIIPNAQEKLQ